jgi:hypothetical protein
LIAALVTLGACTTLPKPKHDKFRYPKDAYVETPKRAYVPVGTVRSKVNFTSLDPNHEETELCKNYYNKAVAELVKFAHAKGADAVIDVKSVVFLEDGRVETYKTPECSDDGGEGQILAQGTAIRWKPESTGSTDPFVLPNDQPPAQRPVITRPSPSPSSAPRH